MLNDMYPNYFYPWMRTYPMMPSMPTPEPEPPTTLPPDFEFVPAPPVQDDINYTQGYLKTVIGEYVKVEFLIGTSMLIDREGKLLEVGISYIVLQEPETDDLLMCDIYSIKFVKILR